MFERLRESDFRYVWNKEVKQRYCTSQLLSLAAFHFSLSYLSPILSQLCYAGSSEQLQTFFPAACFQKPDFLSQLPLGENSQRRLFWSASP